MLINPLKSICPICLTNRVAIINLFIEWSVAKNHNLKLCFQFNLDMSQSIVNVVCILDENVFDYMNIGHDCPHDPPVPTALNRTRHGLRTLNEAFLDLLGLSRQIGQKKSWAFRVFSAKLSAPTLAQ